MSFTKAVGMTLRASVAHPWAAPGMDEVLGRARRHHLRGLAQASAFHGIIGYVDRALAASAAHDRVPDDERTRLREAATQLASRHAAIVDNLRQLAVVFDVLQVPWLVVKGPVLAASAHEAPALRMYEDLDVVVPAADFGDVLGALEQGGAAVLGGDWTARTQARAGEVPVRLPSGVLVDLHWHLINTGTIRDHFRVPMAELFARRVHVDVDGVAVPTLAPADALAHVALHTVLSGSHRLIWIKDVERLLARHGQDVVDTAAATLTSWGGELVMADVMARTARTVGLPPGLHWPPPAVRTARAWLGMAAAADRLSPVERQDGGPSVLRMVSRAVRADAPRSARLLAGKVRARVVEAIPRTPGEPSPSASEPEARRPRARYLDEVVQADAVDRDGAP